MPGPTPYETGPTAYEIVIRGRASARLLRPLLDDFTVDHARGGVTRLVGDISDASHLHGVLAHLTSVGTELISIAPLEPHTDSRATTDNDLVATTTTTTTTTTTAPTTEPATTAAREIP